MPHADRLDVAHLSHATARRSCRIGAGAPIRLDELRLHPILTATLPHSCKVPVSPSHFVTRRMCWLGRFPARCPSGVVITGPAHLTSPSFRPTIPWRIVAPSDWRGIDANQIAWVMLAATRASVGNGDKPASASRAAADLHRDVPIKRACPAR